MAIRAPKHGRISHILSQNGQKSSETPRVVTLIWLPRRSKKKKKKKKGRIPNPKQKKRNRDKQRKKRNEKDAKKKREVPQKSWGPHVKERNTKQTFQWMGLWGKQQKNKWIFPKPSHVPVAITFLISSQKKKSKQETGEIQVLYKPLSTNSFPTKHILAFETEAVEETQFPRPTNMPLQMWKPFLPKVGARKW